MLHGYTSSPYAWRLVADELFRLGFNVLVPRAPRHGLADRQTTVLSELDEDELISWVVEAIDLAHGLGQKVGLAGFSMGGAMALWAASYRHDLDFVGVISPAIAYTSVPLFLTGLFADLFVALPNRMVWWDEETKENGFPLEHGYPRYATRGLGAFTAIAQRVWIRSRRHPPQARQVQFILNPAERALNNARALRMHQRWQVQTSATSACYLLDRDWHLPHDFIDPEHPRNQVATTNPVLVKLLSENW